jgi:NADPH-dependent 2,4-dienoyl-CoA reductase/sulfur reductase-like enzyme/rhodanese-related sulfurtransferase
MKYVIVGGVAGGATAAARIRRIDEKAEIILLEKDDYISYANCGLPYYIGGVIKKREDLFLQTPESFGRRFNIDVRVKNKVTQINPDKKEVVIVDREDNEYIERYDKLLLSPGAVPVIPPISGIDIEGIFTLRNINDTDAIKNYVTTKKIEKALIVGAGFIGLEMAENLHNTGAEVSIVEMSEQVMAPLDFSMAAFVHQHLLYKGINLILEQAVIRFEKNKNKINAVLSDGTIITTDVVILSVGVRPEVSLTEGTDIRLGDMGGILVNEYLETSVKDIYAVGDAIEFPHPLTGANWLNYLANPANRQGRIVADNMVLNNTTKYEGAIGTAIAKIFDLTVASTGLSAKKLSGAGIVYKSSVTHSVSHAGYYPGGTQLSIKLIFDPENGKIFGAQVVGEDGVDKRIDQIALVIKLGGTVFDLTKIEHAYAPPYSSAKDPVAIAGYTATNIVNGYMPVISWREIRSVGYGNTLLLDVRTEKEFQKGSIPGAVNIPLEQLRDRLSEIPSGEPVYVYCAIGLRAYLALRILMANGHHNVKNLSGGYKTYSTATAKVELKNPVFVCEKTVKDK